MRRIFRLFAAMLIAGMAVFMADDARATAIRRIDTSFQYGGRKVRIEIFRPANSVVAPAALVLHGASGVGDGWFVYPFAQALAERGVSAAVVHYYDGLGRRKGKASPKIFAARAKILESAVNFMLSRKDVRPDEIGVYGMSLGGFHALALGVSDPRVKAVASLGGALSVHIPDRLVGLLPATLLLHGSSDRVVPVDRALDVSRAMERHGVVADMKLYAGEGHTLSPVAHDDAVQTVARFLAEGLRPPRHLAESDGR